MMARTKMVQPAEVSGPVREVFDDLHKKSGVVPNFYKALALWPEFLIKQRDLTKSIFESDTRIDRLTKWMILVLVSRLNQCQYCYAWQTLALRQFGASPEKVQALGADWRQGPFTEKEKAVLGLAEKITKTPYAISNREIDRLKILGFSDEEILEISVVVALANADTRLTLTLGINFEAEL